MRTMLRKGMFFALVLWLSGCGTGEDTIVDYAENVQKLQQYNQRIQQYIARFDDPAHQATAVEVREVRDALVEYYTAVQGLASATAQDSALGKVHQLYVRALGEARQQTELVQGDARSQAWALAGALRTLKAEISERIYPAIGVLLSRSNAPGDSLAWPQ